MKGDCLACRGTGRVHAPWPFNLRDERCVRCNGSGNVVPTGAQCPTCEELPGQPCMTRGGRTVTAATHTTRQAVVNAMRAKTKVRKVRRAA